MNDRVGLGVGLGQVLAGHIPAWHPEIGQTRAWREDRAPETFFTH